MTSEEVESKHVSGYLNIIDSLGILKISNKRWFVLGQKTQYVYYYKTPRDTTPAGKIDISTAVFLYDRKNPCCMQIKSSSGDVILEAPDFKTRMKWLEAMQDRRRAWCKMSAQAAASNVNSIAIASSSRNSSLLDLKTKNEENSGSDEPLPGLATFLNANYSAVDEGSQRPSLIDTNDESKKPSAIFYVDNSVEKNRASESNSGSGSIKNRNINSCESSPAIKFRQEPPNSRKSSRSYDGRKINSNNNNGCASSSSAADNALDKLNKILFKISTSKKTCDNCAELISVVSNLKSRCMDLQDELAANRILVESLRANLLAAKNQTNALQRMAEFKDYDQQKIDYVKESETERTYLHLQNSSLRKELNDMHENVRKLETSLKKKNEELDAYKDSLKSKDRMIMKLVEEQSTLIDQRNAKSFENEEINVEQAIEFECSSVDSTGGGSNSKANDFSENKFETLKDLLRGYERQNQFLNKEILELHNVVQCLETREQHMARRNFDLEAEFYQLKSRYLLLLNHFKPNKELAPSVVEELVKDAKEALAAMGTNKHLDITDDLGFYISANTSKHHFTESAGSSNFNDQSFIDFAGQFKKVSDELAEKQKKVASEQYLTWLTKWDSLLVNYTDRTLGPCQELKELVRDGIPHTYRSRVWKSIIFWMVKECVTEAGHGYFECLYKKANALNLQDAYDPAMKQIDLDLARTLPHNKHFEDLNAGKIESLRRVLYAFRWHNPDIGYCQGLNRLAAVSLLYLSEEDSFWALVAIVEHLQPRDYYGNTMLAAQADQRVLRDFVVDKMPKLSTHLKSLEVDLSLFSFNWFLTIFVDSFLHTTYLNVWDSFLYEGNKVLFRFALAVLKLNEPEIMACKTSNALHSCLSKIGENNITFERLSQVAFKDMNPLSSKQIDSRRQNHLSQLKVEMDNLNIEREKRRAMS